MKLIDKEKVVAEIKRRIFLFKKEKKPEKWSEGGLQMNVVILGARIAILEELLSFLDTLEVKEVDLEKEYEDFVVDDPIFGNFITNDTMGMELAKHFFELGLKVHEAEEDIDKNKVIKKISSLFPDFYENNYDVSNVELLEIIKNFIDTLKAKEK
jgi:hypothetical protein